MLYAWPVQLDLNKRDLEQKKDCLSCANQRRWAVQQKNRPSGRFFVINLLFCFLL